MEMPPVPEKLKPLHSAINAALTSGAARSFALAAGAVVVLAAALNAAVILKASYTEIDWVAYVQEVEGPVGRKGWPHTALSPLHSLWTARRRGSHTVTPRAWLSALARA